jgi:hypothetical protein
LHSRIADVEIEYSVHAGKLDNDAAALGDCSTGEAGACSASHQRYMMLRGPAYYLLDIGGRLWKYQTFRGSPVKPGIDLVGD